MLAIIFIVAIIFLALVYILGRYNERYWRSRGVQFYNKNRLLGIMWDFMFKDQPTFEILHEIYKEHPDEPAVGIGGLLTPTLYVIDPKNTHHVLQQDFQNFNHRGLEINADDLLADNILFMNGKRWRLMRQNMTPLFTSAKLRKMYYIMDKASQDFVTFLKENPNKCKGKAYDTLNQFCNAAITAAVFGIGTESTFESPFLEVARKSVESNTTADLKFAASSIMPKALFKYLNIYIFKEYEQFFIGAMKQVFQKRKQEGGKKHDFADLCLSIQEKGVMKDPETGLELEPSDHLLAAQGFFFFIAGVEPCATSIFAALLELGKHPEIQRKVHSEIDAVYQKHGNNITYDIVSEMEYLDKVLSEALRMFPPIGYLTRQCIKDTMLPVGNIPVAAGTKVFTPIFEYHHDARYYKDPYVFNPERFAQPIDDNVYMPFGKGGRVCIGMRYARLQVKAGLLHLLRHFSVSTLGDLRYAKATVQVRIKNVDIHFSPRQFQ